MRAACSTTSHLRSEPDTSTRRRALSSLQLQCSARTVSRLHSLRAATRRYPSMSTRGATVITGMICPHCSIDAARATRDSRLIIRV